MECAPSHSVNGVNDTLTVPIATASARTGLSTDTLRYYEKSGLVDPPARDSAGRRMYSEADLEWLTFVTRLRTTGLPIRRLKQYYELRRLGDTSAARRKHILVSHRAELVAQIEAMTACLGVLDHKISIYEDIERRFSGAEPTAQVDTRHEETA